MAEIIDLTKNERTFQELLGGDGRRGPRRQRQASENGGKKGTCPFISSTGVPAR